MPDSWRDKDDVILHACFQLLKDFVEQEKELIEICDWEHSEEAKNAKSEIDFLYNWWVERASKENFTDEKNTKKTIRC